MVSLELSGQDSSGMETKRRLRLQPGRAVKVQTDLRSLACVHALSLPAGRIGIRSALQNRAEVIAPEDWHNVRVVGEEIWLLGWTAHDRFLALASMVPAGRRVFQFGRTKIPNLAMPVSSLKPIPALIERARAQTR
jgi:hypothetical protein